jgi:hypothetical protein
MKQETTKEPQIVKIKLEQNNPIIKVELEGSIREWIMLLTDVAENSPQFKKAIILSAEYFDIEKNLNN